MNKKTSILIIFIFSIAGTLFAGYLTFTKLLLGVCPLKEPCPVIFGQPACVYGLVLYLILLVSSATLLFKNIKKKSADCWPKTIFWVSFVGILFALYSTYLEVFATHCPGGCSYSLLLPTCVYGLTMYLVIFVFSIILKKASK